MEIDLGEDVAQGNYINLAIIAHSVSEFIIDFATVLPGVPKAKVKSRVILTPEHAKRLLLSCRRTLPAMKAMWENRNTGSAAPFSRRFSAGRRSQDR